MDVGCAKLLKSVQRQLEVHLIKKKKITLSMLCFQRSKTKIRFLVSINGILIKSNLTFEQVNPTPK